MAVLAARASIGCMVTPPKLLREFCSGHSRRCEDVRCWLLWRFAYAGPRRARRHHHGAGIRKPSQKATKQGRTVRAAAEAVTARHWIRKLAIKKGACANIQPKCNRNKPTNSTRVSTEPQPRRTLLQPAHTVSSTLATELLSHAELRSHANRRRYYCVSRWSKGRSRVSWRRGSRPPPCPGREEKLRVRRSDQIRPQILGQFRRLP